MAYKVLGQTSASAASASVTVNLVKDPVFQYTTGTVNVGTTYQTISTSSKWYAAGTNASNNVSTYNTGSIPTGSSSANSSMSIISNGGTTAGTIYLGYGTNNSTNGITVSEAIAVTAGTTYYFGAATWRNSATTTAFTAAVMDINWFNSSETLLSTSSLTLTVSANSDTWVRTTGSATAPTDAVYATILIRGTVGTSSSWRAVFDNIHFSTDSDTNTTFPDPTYGGIFTGTVSPYTGQAKYKWSGIENNSTTINTFAGAYTDIYTVPAGSSAVVSTIAVTNTGTSQQTYRLAVVPSGQSLDIKSFINMETPLASDASNYHTLGLTLAAGDKLQISASSTDVVVSAFGSEN